jgi:uncharacterized protein YecE (DUF72 family)
MPAPIEESGVTNRPWIGCCGWAAAHARYFRQFRTIELQSTFYQPPAVDLAEKWKRDAPEGFRFCLKAWQLITHRASSPTYRRLKTPLPENSRSAVGGFQPTEEVWHAWEATLAIARALDAAVVLFQCPASFRPTGTDVRNLESFFRGAAACRRRIAWEPRGDWPKDLVRDLCSRLGLIHCVDPFADEPVTAGVRYFRLHGRGGYNYRYSDAELRELRAKVIADSGDDTYVMFNNVWMKDDAARFLALIE